MVLRNNNSATTINHTMNCHHHSSYNHRADSATTITTSAWDIFYYLRPTLRKPQQSQVDTRKILNIQNHSNSVCSQRFTSESLTDSIQIHSAGILNSINTQNGTHNSAADRMPSVSMDTWLQYSSSRSSTLRSPSRR